MTDSREVSPSRRGVRRLALGLTATGAATVVAAVLCEVLARLAFPPPPPLPRQPQLTYRQHRDFGFLPLPNQAGWVEGGWATINSLGLRGSEPGNPKPVGSFRILVAGDSTTFGWGVNDHETYAVRLEQLIRHQRSPVRDEVINAGVNGYDLRQTSSLLRYLTPRLQPDLILLGLFWNDLDYQVQTPEGQLLVDRSQLSDVAAEQSGTFQMIGQGSGMRATLRQSRAVYVLWQAWLSAIEKTSRADNAVRWEVALLEGRRTPAIEQAWIEMSRELAEVRTIATDAGAEIAIVIIPIRAQVERDYPDAAYQTRVADIAKRLGITVVDPLPMFRSQRKQRDLFMPFDRMHMSPAGHELMGRTIYDAILGLLR